MKQKNFKIVLVAPDIPGNTGSIGRTCVALGLELILIKPFGFDLSEKAVSRAGLDYWKYVQIKEYNTFDEFIASEKPSNLIFFENDASASYTEAPYQEDCYLIFGSETKGLSTEIYNKYSNQMYFLPQYSEHIRSINLSNAVTAVAYECLRQCNKLR